jgi:NAD(P)-dependent dehydrogenase (short-subunit alcohol dehydrogenase family)
MDVPLRILVIGGTGHVGAVICRCLSLAGHAVAFTYFQNAQKARALAEELKSSCYALDLGAGDAITPTLNGIAEKLGGLDALVVASGLATAHQREGVPVVPKWNEVEPCAFSRMLEVNVKGPFFVCQWAASVMSRQKAGKIVLVGSIDGIKPVPSPVDYACCKAALVGMVHSLSKDLGPHGILVNLIAPGILEGGIAALLSKELHAEYVKHCTLKRIGTAEDIARWAEFLISPRNSYLTGQTIIVDGGL